MQARLSEQKEVKPILAHIVAVRAKRLASEARQPSPRTFAACGVHPLMIGA